MKFILILTTTALISTVYSAAVNDDLIVTTSAGRVQGKANKSRLGETFYSFEGIPYAESSAGELRFQPPVPKKPWSGIWNATQPGPVCYQPPIVYQMDKMSEDCLSLNVYTKNIFLESPEILKSVIVFIHGGGFIFGSGSGHRPGYLMDRDVLVVTLNYRLGTLGFLSTGTSDCPGNMGFKDQVLAIRWVRDNIEFFGGNPTSITLVGHSAGAISVMLHLVSPMSSGLFHRGIMMSGAITPQWRLSENYLDLAKRQARAVGCDEGTTEQILSCLKSTDAESLTIAVSNDFNDGLASPVIKFAPTIEPDFGIERFLIGNPISLITSGNFTKIPIMIGMTKDEFADIAFRTLQSDQVREMINSNFDHAAALGLIYHLESEQRIHNISQTLRRKYFGSRTEITAELFPKFGELLSDGLLGFGTHRFVNLASRHSDVYYYMNSYVGQFSYFNHPDKTPYGTVHSDDLQYLFYLGPGEVIGENDPDSVMVERMTRMWSYFSITGDPINCNDDVVGGTVWPKYDEKRKKYLKIGNDLSVSTNLFVGRYGVWDEVFPETAPEQL